MDLQGVFSLGTRHQQRSATPKYPADRGRSPRLHRGACPAATPSAATAWSRGYGEIRGGKKLEKGRAGFMVSERFGHGCGTSPAKGGAAGRGTVGPLESFLSVQIGSSMHIEDPPEQTEQTPPDHWSALRMSRGTSFTSKTPTFGGADLLAPG